MSIYSDQDGRPDALGRIYHRAPGRKPQPPEYVANKSVEVLLTEAERERARALARRQGISLSQLFRDALDDYRSEIA